MIWQWGGTEQLSDGEVMFKKAVKVRGNEDVLGSIALEQQAVVSIRYCYLVHAYTMPVCQHAQEWKARSGATIGPRRSPVCRTLHIKAVARD